MAYIPRRNSNYSDYDEGISLWGIILILLFLFIFVAPFFYVLNEIEGANEKLVIMEGGSLPGEANYAITKDTDTNEVFIMITEKSGDKANFTIINNDDNHEFEALSTGSPLLSLTVKKGENFIPPSEREGVKNLDNIAIHQKGHIDNETKDPYDVRTNYNKNRSYILLSDKDGDKVRLYLDKLYDDYDKGDLLYKLDIKKKDL